MRGSGDRSAVVTFLLVLEAQQAGPGHLFVLARPLARLQPVAGLRADREAHPGLSPGTRGQRGRRQRPGAKERLPSGGPVAAAGARLFAGVRRRQQRRRLLLFVALSLFLLRVISLAHVHSPGLSEHSRGPQVGLTRSHKAAPAAHAPCSSSSRDPCSLPLRRTASTHAHALPPLGTASFPRER